MANAIQRNIGAIGIGAGGALLGGAMGFAAGRISSRKKTRKKRRAYNKNKRKRSRLRSTKKGRFRKTPRTAGKRRDTSRKRIRYTKNGQPYIILANGRARFLKKSSARKSHKRSGGRY